MLPSTKATKSSRLKYQFLTIKKLFIEQLNQELHSEQKSIEELQKNRTQELADVIKGLE
jgi:hypothetical protein